MSSSHPSNLTQEKVLLIGIGIVILCAIAVFTFSNYRQQRQAETILPPSAPLSIRLGDADEAKTVVVYTDPTCDKCAQYHEDVVVPLYDKYVKEGKINIEVRPLGIVSESAAPLNELIMCSNEQRAYLPTANFINEQLSSGGEFSSIRAATFFDDHSASEIANKTGMDETKLSNCLDDTRYKNKMTRADEQAYAANIYSTPTTFIGNSEPVRGYSTLSYITRLIDLYLLG